MNDTYKQGQVIVGTRIEGPTKLIEKPKKNQDAERILRLPFIHHPQMAERTKELAADPNVDFDKAIDLLCKDMDRLGVSELDLEMVRPGAHVRVPFSASEANTENDFQAGIAQHLHLILNGGKR